MYSRRHLLAAIGVGISALPHAAAAGALASPAAIPRATAITKVFGDGQRFVAVALDYGRPIQRANLSTQTFRVEGRTVINAYVSDAPEPGAGAQVGRYAILELDPDDPGAVLKASGPGGRSATGASGAPGGDAGAMSGPPPGMAAPKFKRAAASITQTAPVTGADGRRYPPSSTPIVTTQIRNLIVDDFRQLIFRDPATGDVLKYNLFVPKGYDPARTYPLVLFMHDAGATSDDPLTTLRQGLGAVAWASPEDQTKRPCFVLAPQYASPTVNDRSEATSLLDTTVHLVESLATQYNLDRNRLYATGQSGGAMMSIAMDIKYPDLFAASYIVAGQWDVAKVAPLASDRLWILVSQGDLKAYPGQNTITAALEAEGAKVARAVWDGRSTPEQFAAVVGSLEAQNAPINYVALAKGTVVPPGQSDDGGSNHINTWRVAYAIEGIRAWLFRQTREGAPKG
jgi:predicted peptidase